MTAHLAECPECAEELRAVMARVRAGEAEPGGLLRWLRALSTPAFAVPLAAGLAGLVLFAGLRDGALPQPGAEPEALERVAMSVPEPLARVAVSEPLPELAPGPARFGARPAIRAGAGSEARPAQLQRRIEIVRAMQRRSLLQQLARRGHTKQVALTLRGAGHPLSSSMASHFEDHEPANVAFASWSPGN